MVHDAVKLSGELNAEASQQPRRDPGRNGKDHPVGFHGRAVGERNAVPGPRGCDAHYGIGVPHGEPQAGHDGFDAEALDKLISDVTAEMRASSSPIDRVRIVPQLD